MSRPAQAMRISIGILAWNEATSIARTIETLLHQTLFSAANDCIESIEVVCVPNGCTDATAAAAEEAFSRCSGHLDASRIFLRVRELCEGDKANAWNHYIHEFSDPEADYVFLMDADVRLRERDAVHRLLMTLHETPTATVAVPTLIKDIQLRTPSNPWHRLSLWAVDPSKYRAPSLSGALYCARGEALRRIWMPQGLLSEDGFLHGLIATDRLCRAPNPGRIIRAKGVSVVYELSTSVSQILHRDRRMAMGRIMNVLLFRELAASCGKEGVGEVVRRRNEENHEWALSFVRKQARLRGIGIGRAFLLGRIRGRSSALRQGDLLHVLPRALVVGGRIVLDLLIAWVAYGLLVRGRSRGAW